MENKNTYTLGKKFDCCGNTMITVIILKESIRFRAVTKRTAYTKDKLL